MQIGKGARRFSVKLLLKERINLEQFVGIQVGVDPTIVIQES